MPMFDPSNPMLDFEVQAQNAMRQRLLADRLRKQADQPGPQGQMIQGRFVAPHWSQHLGGLVDALSAHYADKRASTAENQANTQQGQAAEQWRSQMPTDVPGTVAIPGDIDNRPDMPTGVDATAGQPLTRQRILQHTLAGLANPRTAKEAALVNQSLTSDLQRKEDMGFRDEEARKAEAFRASESAATRLQAAELKREQLAAKAESEAARLEDRNLDRVLREQLAKQHNATLLAMNAATNEARLAAIEARRELTDEKTAAAKKDTEAKDLQKNVLALSNAAETLAPMRGAAQAVQELIDSSGGDPNKIEGLGLQAGLHPRLRSEQANLNLQKVQLFANAITRAQAGLSQTLSEQQKVDLETMATLANTPKEFVKAWPENAKKLNAILANLRAKVPPSALDEYKLRGGANLSDVIPGTPAFKPALPKTIGADVMPPGMDPVKWKRLQELRAAAGGPKP